MEKKGLTIKEICSLFKGIIDEEKKKYGVKLDNKSYSYVHYCTGIVLFSDQNFVDLVKTISNNMTTAALFDKHKNRIVFFPDRFYKIKDINMQYFEIVFTAYHEFRHKLQTKKDVYSYEGFIDFIEKCYIVDHPNHYYENHDNYSFEIGANLYAMNKTKEFMKSHSPNTYNKLIDYIDIRERMIIDDYLGYSPWVFLDEGISYAIENELISSKSKDNKLYIFFNDDGTPKTITEIRNNEDFEKLDKRVVYTILMSKTYLKGGIKDKAKSVEDKELLSRAAEYYIKMYNNIEISNENKGQRKF